MKPSKIKGIRCEFGYTQQYMAEQLGITVHSYRKKERGEVRFTKSEKEKVIKLLKFSPEDINECFCDGLFPLELCQSADFFASKIANRQ